MSFLQPLSLDKDDSRWKESLSFFMSVKTELFLEFGRNAEGFEHPILDSLNSVTGMLFNHSIKEKYEQTRR
jgi:hypothetical protein